jgi:hypothetical protein
MGLFDTIIFAGAGDCPRCADGHDVRHLQTKQMGNGMVTYLVWEKKLYQPEPDGSGSWPAPKELARHVPEGDHLVITHEMQAHPFAGRVVDAYGTCEACLPVLVEASSERGGWIIELSPRVEFTLCFEGDWLREWTPRVVESRDDLRRKQPGVIPDDDLVARRFFERWEAARRGG